MSKKVLFLASALAAGMASTALANGPTVTLGGNIDTTFGVVKQEGLYKHIDADENKGLHNSHALVNDVKLHVKVDGKAENGLGYGGVIKINANTSDSKDTLINYDKAQAGIAEQTMTYVEGMFGRFEVGNYTGATHAMQVGATNFARGAGAEEARFWYNRTDASNYLEAADLPTNNLAAVGAKGVNAAKVTYYSPSFSGFKIGLSYVPDIDVHGTVASASEVNKGSGSTDEFSNVKDIFEGGIQYDGKFDQVGFKAALLGQSGKSKSSNTRDLAAYETGLAVNYMGFTFGGSYGSYDKSLTTKGQKVAPTKYWTIGAAYGYGPMGTSLTYTETKKGSGAKSSNKLKNVSLGVDYKLADGFMPYAEVSHFSMNDGVSATKDNKGTVFLLGTNLMF